MAEHDPIEVAVYTPEGEVFDGEATQVSTRTTIGEIGILRDHVPILARLEPCELRIHLSEGETRRWAQAEGWLEVFANRALLLVQEATDPADLDRSELQSRLDDAQARLDEAEEGSAAGEQAERDKRRAEAFLTVLEGAE